MAKAKDRNSALNALEVLPWADAFQSLNALPDNELLTTFESLLFKHTIVFERRELFVVTLVTARRIAIGFTFGFTIGTSPDVIVDLKNEGVLLRSSTESFTKFKASDSLFIVMMQIRGSLMDAIKLHVRDNVKLAVDVFKLAACEKLYDVIPINDLHLLVRYFSTVARRKSWNSVTKSLTQTKAIGKRAESDSVIAKPVRAKPVAKPKTSKSFKSVRWHEATATDPGNGTGFILTEQHNGSWLVTYNNHMSVVAWNFDAARELVGDVIADPSRIKEFKSIPGNEIVKEATVIRLQK